MSVLNVNNGQLVNVRLYGTMGKLFGRKHALAVSSAAEAVRALCLMLPGFERYLTEAKDNGYGFAVFYGKSNLAEEDLRNPVDNDDDIRIAPILFGSKNGGWFNVIVGVVLVVIGAIVSYFVPGLGVPIMKMGVGLIVGGVVQLLAPVPKGTGAQDRPENKASYVFNGPINTQAQGNPVPVLYGECIVGSAVLSAGINAIDQAYIPRDGVPAGSGGSGGGGSSLWNEVWRQVMED